MRSIFVGLLAISFTLTAVGCGGDPCADYEKKLCADEKSKGACEDFKKQLAKAKQDGTAGNMNKTCETSLANWDKRGEGVGKNEEAVAAAAKKMAEAKKSCEGDGGTYSQESGCMCADGKPQKIAKMADGKAVMKDGKKVWERESCPAKTPEPPKAAPPKTPEPPKAGDTEKKDEGEAAAAPEKKEEAKAPEGGEAKPAEGEAKK